MVTSPSKKNMVQIINFTVVLSALLVTSTAFAASPIPSVAVVETIDLSAPNEKFHPALREAAEDAVKREGWLTVPMGKGPSCKSAECLERIGSATGATYVLLLDGAYTVNNYVFEVRLFRTGKGWASSPQDNPPDCALCSVQQMVDHVRTWTGQSVSAEQRRIAAAPVQPALDLKATPLETPTAKASWRKPTAVALTLAGLAITVWGVVALSRDGNGIGCLPGNVDCDSRQQQKGGWPAVGIGSLLFGSGMYLGFGGSN